MSAMDSSSRNAGDMLDRLTLTYNRSLLFLLPFSHAQNLIFIDREKGILWLDYDYRG